MKVKHLLTFVASLLCVGVNAQTWDFTSMIAEDKANLAADGTNWKHDESGTRFENLQVYDCAILKASDNEVAYTKDIYFTGKAGKFRLNYGNSEADPQVPGKLQLNGKDLTLTIKDCKKGSVITVVCETAKKSEARGFNVSNITRTSGYFNVVTTEEQVNVGTISEDGEITLTTQVGGMNVTSIKIEAPSSETAISDVETVQFNGLIGDELVLSNLAAGARVAVFDAQGREVLSSTSAGSNANISVSALRPGVYVLSAGNSSFKFVKR